MTGITSVELDHCRELVMQPGSLFEFTSRFLDSGQSEAVLALYALRHSICNIPYTPVDDTVKWAKLKWWSQELLEDVGSPSRHPVLRVLEASGARARINNAQLLALVGGAVTQIDAAPDGDEGGLLERLAESGAPGIEAELALAEAEIDTGKLDLLGAASSLFQLVSSFSPGEDAQVERLPLNLLAEHGVSTAQLQQDACLDELSSIISRVAGLGLDWFAQGMSGLEVSVSDRAGESIAAHLQLRWAMERRGLQLIRKNAGSFITEGTRYGPGDAWFAWRYLRQLR